MNILEIAEKEFFTRKSNGTLPIDLPRGKDKVLVGVQMLLDRGDNLLAIYIVHHIAATSGLDLLRKYGEIEAADMISAIR